MTLDRLKQILGDLEIAGTEPAGNDDDLINALDAMSAAPFVAPAAVVETKLPDPVVRELKPGEVSLDDLERAFLEAEGPDLSEPLPLEPAPVAMAEPKQPEFTAPEFEPASLAEDSSSKGANRKKRVGRSLRGIRGRSLEGPEHPRQRGHARNTS